MVLKELIENPLLPPAGGPAGAEGALVDGDEVTEEDKAAADTTEVVLEDDELLVVAVLLTEDLGGGATSALVGVGWAMLDETLLLELEDSVPDDAAAVAPEGTISARPPERSRVKLTRLSEEAAWRAGACRCWCGCSSGNSYASLDGFCDWDGRETRCDGHAGCEHGCSDLSPRSHTPARNTSGRRATPAPRRGVLPLSDISGHGASCARRHCSDS